jgi:MoaA/NifB/PqqE/SkfB family radical SAM enzyme
MLSQIHLLLTYRCDFACDHCFLYCGPRAEGTFTLKQIAEVLDQAEALGTIEWIYFEGGEPSLVYSLMVEGIRMAGARGFKTGIVTNGNWARSDEEARSWLEPLRALGVADVSMSSDGFHGSARAGARVKTAMRAARALGLPLNTITVEEATVISAAEQDRSKGAAIIGGDVVFRGRAADRLTEGLPRAPARAFTECPFEDLETPERVHVDCFGNVQFCQGLSIGSLWQTPLSRLFADYRAASHPICGPLVEGGPARLAEVHGLAAEERAVTACHLCFRARRALIDRFPDYLTPRQVYGLS